MPAQMLAASGPGGTPDSVAAAAGQQDSTGRGNLPTTGGGDNAAEGPLQKVWNSSSFHYVPWIMEHSARLSFFKSNNIR